MTESQPEAPIVIPLESPLASTTLTVSPQQNPQLIPINQLVRSYRHKTFPHLQTLESLTCISGFIPDHIFPFLCGRDQLQLANSSPVLLRQLADDLPPKIICMRCMKTLISSSGIPANVKFLCSGAPYNTTLAISLCVLVPDHPLSSDDMKWARDKFVVGAQKHMGAPVLHCKRCNAIVAILVIKPIHEVSPNCAEWIAEILETHIRKYQFAQIIIALESGTRYIRS